MDDQDLSPSGSRLGIPTRRGYIAAVGEFFLATTDLVLLNECSAAETISAPRIAAARRPSRSSSVISNPLGRSAVPPTARNGTTYSNSTGSDATARAVATSNRDRWRLSCPS